MRRSLFVAAQFVTILSLIKGYSEAEIAIN